MMVIIMKLLSLAASAAVVCCRLIWTECGKVWERLLISLCWSKINHNYADQLKHLTASMHQASTSVFALSPLTLTFFIISLSSNCLGNRSLKKLLNILPHLHSIQEIE